MKKAKSCGNEEEYVLVSVTTFSLENSDSPSEFEQQKDNDFPSHEEDLEEKR